MPTIHMLTSFCGGINSVAMNNKRFLALSEKTNTKTHFHFVCANCLNCPLLYFLDANWTLKCRVVYANSCK